MNLTVLKDKYSIYKFGKGASLPEWIFSSGFYSVTKTEDELSVVAAENNEEYKDAACNRNWRILKVEGPLDFSLCGIIADLSSVFKKHNIPVFIISTYDTDYILLKEKDLNPGIEFLSQNGHNIKSE